MFQFELKRASILRRLLTVNYKPILKVYDQQFIFATI